MKNKINIKIVLLMLIGIMLLLTGCENLNQEAENNGDTEAEKYIKSNYGSFELPKGLEKNKEHSTRIKQFYVLEEDKEKSKPNNISINGGTTPYSKDNHMAFRQDVLKQIGNQSAGRVVNINGNRTNTKNGDTLYIFTMKESGSTTTQYYIVGDKKYFLVHETTFDDDTEKIDQKTKEIVDSFKWNV